MSTQEFASALDVVMRLGFSSGDLMAVGAAAMWAIFNLASRHVVGRLSPTVTNCTIFSLSGLVLFAVGLPEAPVAQLVAAPMSVWLGILVMAVLSSVIAGQLFLTGVRIVGVSRAVTFVYLVPVLIVLAASARALIEQRRENREGRAEGKG
jgi:drug/metabolite transporter (DMT)-like permease